MSVSTPTGATSAIRANAERGAALFLRITSVMRITGLGRSTIYQLMAKNQFPHPVRLTKRVVAWRPVDLEQWGEAKGAAPTDRFVVSPHSLSGRLGELTTRRKD